MSRREYKKDGSIMWVDGKDRLHREDGPAFIDPKGHQEWYREDYLHRKDGPVSVDPKGHQEWYRHGRLHDKRKPYEQG